MKPTISYADFEKLDIRVGTVIGVEIPEWSTKLLRIEVDFGTEIGKRIMFSGIQKWYKAEDFLDKQFMFVVNMQPKKMGSFESQGMMLMVDADKPILIPLLFPVENGTVVR